MHRTSNKSLAAERARWLVDLANAIDQAQQLAWRLAHEEGHPEASSLYSRLECAREEIDALRRSGWADVRQDFPSEWIELLPESLVWLASAPET